MFGAKIPFKKKTQVLESGDIAQLVDSLLRMHKTLG